MDQVPIAGTRVVDLDSAGPAAGGKRIGNRAGERAPDPECRTDASRGGPDFRACRVPHPQPELVVLRRLAYTGDRDGAGNNGECPRRVDLYAFAAGAEPAQQPPQTAPDSKS